MDYNPYEDHHHQLSPNCFFIPNPSPTSSLAESTAIDHRDRGDRFPQWTQAETREFLNIRAELDQSFSETKRNKGLWEKISSMMQQKGFIRTPEQCKSKWKNLVTRYKGSEAMEGDPQFAFHEEMRCIFSERMDRLLHFDKGKDKANNDVEGEEKSKKRKRTGGDIEEVLRKFLRKQMEMEMRWMEAAEAREAERRSKEEEWRREMIALHEERTAMERRWMEKVEERWVREEARDERRHAIITAILSKIENK